MKYYMAVTADKYELPIYVAESVPELARKIGMSVTNANKAISLGLNGKRTGKKLIRIEVEE